MGLPTFVPALVVGAGPTGLLTANLLGTYGVETLVVERNATTSDLPKAILLDDEGLRAMQAVGLAERVVERLISGYGARYYGPDGGCFAEVESRVTRNGYPHRNSFLQPDLEGIMAVGLDRFKGVRAEFRTRLVALRNEGERVAVTLELADRSLHEMGCQFLLGCDGGRSTVRDQLGIGMAGMTDSRDWVVVDTVNDPDPDPFSKFFCDPARPMVSIPAPGGGRRYEYMILPGEDAELLSRREMMRSVLSRFRLVPDEDILRAVVYTFHARVAQKLTSGRIALLGDAAHLSPPFAGQGMNAGLRDAFNVAWKVKLGLDDSSSAKILQTYETERMGPATEMIEYAVALGEIVMPVGGVDEAAKARIRDHLIGGTGSLRGRPESVYTDGWLLPSSHESLVGTTFPQFPVRLEDGDVRLLDDVLGAGFALIAIGDEAAHSLAELAQSATLPLAASVVAIGGKGPEIAGVTAVDNDFGLSKEVGRIFLVRPDRFVAAQWTVPDVRRIAEDVSSLLFPSTVRQRGGFE